MKNLVIAIAMICSTTAFANDPAKGHDAHGTTTQADPTTPETPADKNAKTMKKHKGTKGKEHPKVSQPADTKADTTHQQ